MTTNPRHLFVYGTLRRDAHHEMHRVLAQGSTFVGEGEINARLYDLGGYPGIVLSDVTTDLVRGEVYALDAAAAPHVLRVLDDYEGLASADLEPGEYRRDVVRARLHNAQFVEAWAYVLTRLLPTHVPIPGPDYLAWRKSRTT